MSNFPGPDKILMLAVIALVVLGPKRLPDAARTAGKWIGELRKLTSRFQEEMTGALGEHKDALTSAVGDLHKEVGSWRNEVAGFSRNLTAPLTGAATAATAAVPTPPSAGTNGTNGTNGGNGTSPSSAPSSDSVPSALAPTGLPSMPPAPDDPSLN